MTLAERLMEKGRQEAIALAEELAEKGREEGIEKGLLAGKREMAKNMLLEGEAMEKIIKYTGLGKDEVNTLKKEIEG